MGILDRLYLPTTKDIGSGNANVRRWWKTVQASAVAGQVTTTDAEVGPADLVRIIQNVCFSWSPGAAQTAVNAYLYVLPIGGVTPIEVVGTSPQFVAPAAFPILNTLVGVDLIWMQGEQIFLQGQFSAGAASNTITAFLSGLELPRANIQR